MILSGPEIKKQREAGKIKIDPWEDQNLGPNSYNLSLAPDLLWFPDEHRGKPIPAAFSMDRPQSGTPLIIPEEGLFLLPGYLYLGRTQERTYTEGLVPMLEGRSSVGRLGLAVHITAGFGDDGFNGFWTLELFCIQPIKIFSGIPIAQIFYHTMQGERMPYSSDKYQNNKGVQESQLWKDTQRKRR